MLTSRGRVRVDSLASELGWSRKRLWSRFRSQIGLTPKRAVRLVRFDHAAHLLAAGNAAARVAAASGYADQAHLHREVAAFTGMTPTALVAVPWLAIEDVAWPTSFADQTPSTMSATPCSAPCGSSILPATAHHLGGLGKLTGLSAFHCRFTPSSTSGSSPSASTEPWRRPMSFAMTRSHRS